MVDMGLPEPRPDDDEDVVWGLSTASALWARGERNDAIVWLRRASEAASAVGQDFRASEIGMYAAELEDLLTAEPNAALPPLLKREPSPSFSDAATLPSFSASQLIGGAAVSNAASDLGLSGDRTSIDVEIDSGELVAVDAPVAPPPRRPASVLPPPVAPPQRRAASVLPPPAAPPPPANASAPPRAPSFAPPPGTPLPPLTPPRAPSFGPPPPMPPSSSGGQSPASFAPPPQAPLTPPRAPSFGPPAFSPPQPPSFGPPAQPPSFGPPPPPQPPSFGAPAQPPSFGPPPAPLSPAAPSQAISSAPHTPQPAAVRPPSIAPPPPPAPPPPAPPPPAPPPSEGQLSAGATKSPSEPSPSASRRRTPARAPILDPWSEDPTLPESKVDAALRAASSATPARARQAEQTASGDVLVNVRARVSFRSSDDDDDVVTSAAPLDATLKKKLAPRQAPSSRRAGTKVEGAPASSKPALDPAAQEPAKEPAKEAPAAAPPSSAVNASLSTPSAAPPVAALPKPPKITGEIELLLPDPLDAPTLPAAPSPIAKAAAKVDSATRPSTPLSALGAAPAAKPASPAKPPSQPAPKPSDSAPAKAPSIPAPAKAPSIPAPAPPAEAKAARPPSQPAPAPVKVPVPAKAPEPAKAPVVAKAPEAAKASVAPKAPEAAKSPAIAKAAEPAKAPAPVKATEPAKAPAVAKAPEVAKAPAVAKAPEPAKAPPAPEPAKAAPKLGDVSLDEVSGLGDLPVDAQEQLVRAARIEELGPDEEVSGFGVGVLLEGEAVVCATIVDAPACKVIRGALVPSRGSLGEAVSIRVVAGPRGAKVAVWDQALIEATLRACPWVLDELGAEADRIQARAGATMGALGDLDEGAREALLDRLTVRAYGPNAPVLEGGATQLGVMLVGAGSIEHVGATSRAGDWVLQREVMSKQPAPYALRAGASGALVLTAEARVAQELLLTVPPLAELLSG